MNESWEKEYAGMVNKILPEIVDNDFVDIASEDDLFVRWGFCWCDLLNCDLTKLDFEHLQKLTFNSSTKWPSKDKMPKDFDPDKIIENGKNPMLGVKEIHSKGITGKGVIVAVIDELPNIMHEEIKDSNIKIINSENLDKIHFHGECVLANLCGKTIGVAPEANVLYYAKNGNRENKGFIKIFKDILQRLKNGEKIKIISRSGPSFYDIDYEGKEKDKKEINSLISQIESLGCKVLDSKEFSKNFTCGQYHFYDDNTNIDNIKKEQWISENAKEKLMFVCAGKCVPQKDSNTGYKFEQIGCYSWTIPQCAGLYALCLQNNSNLNFDKFVEICKNTFDLNKNGYKIINPSKIIEKSNSLISEKR